MLALTINSYVLNISRKLYNRPLVLRGQIKHSEIPIGREEYQDSLKKRKWRWTIGSLFAYFESSQVGPRRPSPRYKQKKYVKLSNPVEKLSIGHGHIFLVSFFFCCETPCAEFKSLSKIPHSNLSCKKKNIVKTALALPENFQAETTDNRRRARANANFSTPHG